MKNKFIIIVLVFCLMINIFYPAKANADIDIVPDNIKPYLAAALAAGGVIYNTAEGIEGAVQSYWDTLSNTVKDTYSDLKDLGVSQFIMTSAMWSSISNWTQDVDNGVIDNLIYNGIANVVLLDYTIGGTTVKTINYLEDGSYEGKYRFEISCSAYNPSARIKSNSGDLIKVSYDLESFGNDLLKAIEVKVLVGGNLVVLFNSGYIYNERELTNLIIDVIVDDNGVKYACGGSELNTTNKYKLNGKIHLAGGQNIVVSTSQVGAIDIPVSGNIGLDPDKVKNRQYDPTGKKIAIPPGALENLLDYLSNDPDVYDNMPESDLDLETGTMQSWAHQLWQTALNTYNLLRDLPASIASMLSSLFIPTIALTDVFDTVKLELGNRLLVAVPNDFLAALQDKEPPIWYLGEHVLIDWADYDSLIDKIKSWCGGIMIVLTTIWCIKMWMPRTTID